MTHKIVVTEIYREGRKIVGQEKKEIDLNKVDYMEFRLAETFIYFLDGNMIEVEESEEEMKRIISISLKM